MTTSLKIDRRAFLNGVRGMALALPVLDVMGAEATTQPPRRFCAIYTANGMSLPKTEHDLNEWSWFPRGENNGEFVFGKSTEPLSPFRKQLSFMGGLYHPSGPKADPHTCSDMWLTGAPLHNPKPGTYNTAGLDQVIGPQSVLGAVAIGIEDFYVLLLRQERQQIVGGPLEVINFAGFQRVDRLQ